MKAVENTGTGKLLAREIYWQLSHAVGVAAVLYVSSAIMNADETQRLELQCATGMRLIISMSLWYFDSIYFDSIVEASTTSVTKYYFSVF